MENNIAFIGPPEYVRSFQFLGFISLEARNSAEASLIADEAKDNFKLLFVSRDVWERPPEEGIIILPGNDGNRGDDGIKKLIHQALGKNIDL